MTAVQARTLPITLRGKDVAVQSQTGTGKSAAFLITLFHRMLTEGPVERRKGLVIVPTRELAVQIEKEALLLGRHTGLSVGSVYGGVGYAGQLALLKKGLDVVIGTPGRLLDLAGRGNLKLKEFGFLVLDEADRMLDMGFLPDIEDLLRRMPPRKSRQNMLFSATLNRISRVIAAEHMCRPVSIEVTPEKLTVDTITQELFHVKSHVKLNLMLGILRDQTPRNALIFTNTRHMASRLAEKLRHNGFPCRFLTGDLPQGERLKIMEGFKRGEFSLLVATDVAARGLHIDDLDMVINYDLPQDFENYVHRIGRTARAGNSGRAISLASEGTADRLEEIESFIGMEIPVQQAEISLFATDRSMGIERPREFRSRKTGKNGKKPRPQGRRRDRSNSRSGFRTA